MLPVKMGDLTARQDFPWDSFSHYLLLDVMNIRALIHAFQGCQTPLNPHQSPTSQLLKPTPYQECLGHVGQLLPSLNTLYFVLP